jgi:hypothetical protein
VELLVFVGSLLFALALVVVIRLVQGMGGQKAAQRRRTKLAEQVGPFLQAGEQIKSVFGAIAPARHNSIGYEQNVIFAVTDRAIVVLYASLTGRPKQVRQRYSPNLGLGRLQKSPWGLVGGIFTFDGATYRVPWRNFADVEEADAALSEMAQHEPADSVGGETPRTSSPEASPDVAAADPADTAVSDVVQPQDVSASPQPRKVTIFVRAWYVILSVVFFLTLIRVAVQYPLLRWVAIPILLLWVWRIVFHLGRFMHRAWVGHKGIHAPIWLIGGFIVGVIAAVVIPGIAGGYVLWLVWAVSLVVALVLFIGWARDAIGRRRAANTTVGTTVEVRRN